MQKFGSQFYFTINPALWRIANKTQKIYRLSKFSFSKDPLKEHEEKQQKIKEQLEREAQTMKRDLSKFFESHYDTNEVTSEVRVRYAPSPTGDLHIGGLRTALYNYLFAQGHNGKFILRIEDTDKTREVEGATDRMVEIMQWSGLQWDEGPGSKSLIETGKDGPLGPYIQSQRLPIYQNFIKTLIENGDAYHCFCTPERLKDLRIKQGGQKNQNTKYDRFCLGLNKEEIQKRIENGEQYVIRMLVPKGQTEFKDIVHGKINFNHNTVDDQVLIKSDGFPTYHFANVVDDYLMKISHEWLSSTPKHLILYKMLQITPPQFAHLPLLLNSKGQKLSKRFGDVSVQSYREKGFIPEALLNGLALLGWNPPHREDPSALSQAPTVFMKNEVMTLKNIIDVFNIDKIGKSGVKLDHDKLEYLNSMHIRSKFEYFNDLEMKKAVNSWRKMLLENMDSQVHASIKKMNEKKMIKIMDIMKIRIRFFSDMNNHTYFFTDPHYKTTFALKCIKKLKQPIEVKVKILKDLYQSFFKLEENSEAQEINKICSIYLYQNSKEMNLKNEDVFFLMRFVITGNHVGAPIGEVCEIIGMKEVLNRLEMAIDFFENLNLIEFEKQIREEELSQNSIKSIEANQ